MASSTPSQVAHCPRCLCPIEIGQSYSVQVCLPAHPSYASGVPNSQVPPNAATHTSPPSVPHHHHHHHPDTPAPPYEPPSHLQPAEGGRGNTTHDEHHPPPASTLPSGPQRGGQGNTVHSESDRSPTSRDSTQPVGGQNRTARGQGNNSSPLPSSSNPQPVRGTQDNVARRENRRSSVSSASTVYSEFSDFAITTEFVADFQVLEDLYLSPEESFQPSSPPPPPSSSPLPASSPPTEASALPTSSPPPELQPVLPELGVSPLNPRRWVVFRGRSPGIYASATEATSQTNGFPHAFMLAFDDLSAANAAYQQFQGDGVIPNHGRGPWVVFLGRSPGVFTSYKELCASVVGFRGNSYRCCESVAEGNQALRAFRAQQANVTSSGPTTQTDLGSTHRELLDPPVSPEDSWWFCFAGAEPGVYQGLTNLTNAGPAPGGARRIGSEAEGQELWEDYFNKGKIDVIARS